MCLRKWWGVSPSRRFAHYTTMSTEKPTVVVAHRLPRLAAGVGVPEELAFEVGMRDALGDLAQRPETIHGREPAAEEGREM